MIIEHRGRYFVECFNRFIDSSKGKKERVLQFYNRARRFEIDSIGGRVGYSLDGQKLEFLDEFLLTLNDSSYRVRKFGNYNPATDGGYNYYFLDGYGFIYEKSTTWYSSIKIIETDNEELNLVLPGIFELLQRRDCSKRIESALGFKVPKIVE